MHLPSMRNAGAVRSHLCPVPLAPSRAGGCRRRAAIHGRILASVGERLPEPRTACRDGHALADHVESSDLCADRRHCRRADDLAARATGRAAQLGLSFLLAARRDADAPRPDEHGILRRGAGMARLAVARRRRQPGADPNHVRGRRRTMAGRARGAVARRIRELEPRAHRERAPPTSCSSMFTAK